jgi:ABC-type antimicrobial peptide transport system permease subunit
LEDLDAHVYPNNLFSAYGVGDVDRGLCFGRAEQHQPTEGVTMFVTMEACVIAVLVAFIFGIIVGGNLVRGVSVRREW